MTVPAAAGPPAAAGTRTWRVKVVMPCWETGKHAGEPVGWLSMNNLPDNRREKIRFGKAKKLWRLASYEAITVAGVPSNLPRIRLDVEFRTSINNIKDPANLELTLKPVIDAIGPQRIYETTTIKKVKFGSRVIEAPVRRIQVEVGHGIIAGDDPRYLTRTEPTFGPVLGRNNPIKGVVILTIHQLPPQEAT